MANILSFAEVDNISEVHIKTDTSKEKIINVHIEYIKIIHVKAFEEVIFYSHLNDPTMITNPTNFSLKSYSYLYTVKQNLEFFN